MSYYFSANPSKVKAAAFFFASLDCNDASLIIKFQKINLIFPQVARPSGAWIILVPWILYHSIFAVASISLTRPDKKIFFFCGELNFRFYRFLEFWFASIGPNLHTVVDNRQSGRAQDRICWCQQVVWFCCSQYREKG